MHNLVVRRAVAADIPFLVDGIIAAEKSGTETLSYCTIFDLSEPDLRQMLALILAEDVEGQELCVSGFMVAELASTLAGAACAWVEGAGGKPSGVLKGNLLHHFVGRARIAAAAARLRLIEELNFPRLHGTLQVESVYVCSQHRGRGIFAQLLAAHEADAQRLLPAKAHIVLVKNNAAALRAYEKAGFAIVAERQSNAPGILELLPAAHKVLMEKPLQLALPHRKKPADQPGNAAHDRSSPEATR